MDWDVAVVGAGLAGLQVARLLGNRGFRVLLLDRKTSIAAAIPTTGIFVRKTWLDFPMPEEHLGTPIRDVYLYSPALRRLRLTAGYDEFRIGRMEWLYLFLLDQCIRAGVHWLPGATVIGCEEGAVTLLRGGLQERFTVRYIVGADGARSSTAGHLGLDRNSDFLVGMEEIVELRSAAALHCFLDPRHAPGYIGWIAADGSTAHVGVAGYPARFDPALALAAFRRRVAHIAGGRAIERRGGLIPVNGILRRLANRSGLLVGDAAGAVSPLTAGGLDGAVRLSAFAAKIITAYLDCGDPAILRAYDGKRFQSRFLARRWMRRLLGRASHPMVQEMAFAVLALTPLRALAEHIFFSRGSFPDPTPSHFTFARNHSANAG